MRIIAGDLRGRRISAPEGMRTRPMLDRVRQAVFNIVGAAYGDPGSVPPVAVLDVFAGSGALGIEALSRGAAWCCFVEEDAGAVRTLQGNLKELELTSRTEVVRGSAIKVKVPRPPVGGQGTGDGGRGTADNSTGQPAPGGPARPADSAAASNAGGVPADKDAAQAEAWAPNEDRGTPANTAGMGPDAGMARGPAPAADAARTKGQGGRYSLVFLDPPYPLSRDSSVRSPVGQLLAKLPEIAPLDPSVLVVLRHEVEVHYDDNVYGRFEAIDVRRYGGMAVTFLEMT